MKKISLKNLNLKEVEQLSRVQLKSVLGGFNVSTNPSGGSCKCDTECIVFTNDPDPDCSMICEGMTNANCYD